MSNIIDLPSCVLRKVLPDSHTFEITCCNFTGRTFLDCKVGNQWYMYRIPPGNYGTPFLARNPKDASQALWVHDIWTDNDLDLDTSTTVVIPKK